MARLTRSSDEEHHPLASARLRASRDEIVRRWEDQVRRSIPVDKTPRDALLRDHIPVMLDRLAQALASRETFSERHLGDLGRKHGEERAKGPMDLNEILLEYGALRQTLLEVLERKEPLAIGDREIIIQAVEFAMRSAVAEFLRLKDRQTYLQAKKRYPRLWIRALIAIILVALGTGLQLLLWPYMDPAPSLLYYPMVILAALYGGGFLAALLSAAAIQYYFDDTRYSFEFAWPYDFVNLSAFLIGAGLISWITGSLGTAQRRAEILAGEEASARREAEEAIRELHEERELRERFVSTLTHDLRTPLTAIKTGAQFILKFPDRTDSIMKFVTRILKSSERADRMVQDLLDANRLKAGEHLHLQFSACNLNTLVENALSELAVSHGDRFVVRTDEGITGHWSCDGIGRVIQNLVTNAIKYGSKDAPITISLRRAQDDQIRLAVHNEGSYLSPADQESLFIPFSRTTEAKESGMTGWGIGLSLVRGIAEAHGGEVQVESSLESGTTFTVLLPVDARQSESPGLKTDFVEKPQGRNMLGSGSNTIF